MSRYVVKSKMIDGAVNDQIAIYKIKIKIMMLNRYSREAFIEYSMELRR